MSMVANGSGPAGSWRIYSDWDPPLENGVAIRRQGEPSNWTLRVEGMPGATITVENYRKSPWQLVARAPVTVPSSGTLTIRATNPVPPEQYPPGDYETRLVIDWPAGGLKSTDVYGGEFRILAAATPTQTITETPTTTTYPGTGIVGYPGMPLPSSPTPAPSSPSPAPTPSSPSPEPTNTETDTGGLPGDTTDTSAPLPPASSGGGSGGYGGAIPTSGGSTDWIDQWIIGQTPAPETETATPAPETETAEPAPAGTEPNWPWIVGGAVVAYLLSRR